MDHKLVSNLFNNISAVAKLSIKKNKIDMRKVTNTIEDCLLYKFLYRYKESTQNKIISNINCKINSKDYKNNDPITDSKNIKRSALVTKASHIPLCVYQDILDNVSDFYNANTKTNTNNYRIIAGDGVNSNVKINNNDYNESLTMGFFDQSNDTPLLMEFQGLGSKADEVNKLKDIINKNKFFNLNNPIIVLDRASDDFELLDLMDATNLGFVVRIKKNSPFVTLQEPTRYNDSYQNYLKIKHNKKIRTISFKTNNHKTIVTSINNVNIIEGESEYALITNLDKNIFPDEKIKEIYKLRWQIELYFKFLKNNFKFDCMESIDEDDIQKNILIDMIIFYIMKIIEVLNKNTMDIVPKYITNQKTGQQFEASVKFNRTLIAEGLRNSLFYNIFNNNIDETVLNNFQKNYLIIEKNKTNRNSPRSCKNPLKKWYTKQYQNKYKEEKEKSKTEDSLKKSKILEIRKKFNLIIQEIETIVSMDSEITKIRDLQRYEQISYLSIMRNFNKSLPQ